MTLSLISKDLIEKFGLKANAHVKIANPVSLEYEYMRTTLIPSLTTGLLVNNQEKVMLFEIDKVYPAEVYKIAAVAKGIDFRTFKGSLDLIFERLNTPDYKIDFETNTSYFHPSKGGVINIGGELVGEFGFLSLQVTDKLGIKDEVLCFELDISNLEKHISQNVYKPVPENPPQIEDMTLTLPSKTRIGDVAGLIKSSNQLINKVELKDIFNDAYTFRIWYQDPKKTITNEEVGKIREKIISSLKTKFGASVKG